MRTLTTTVFASAILAACISAAGAQTTTTTSTTTWSPADGTAITQYSTTQKSVAVSDPALVPTVGMVLPETVTAYPLPPTISIPSPDQYSYTVINNQPVVIDRTTRKVVHVWTTTSTTAPQ